MIKTYQMLPGNAAITGPINTNGRSFPNARYFYYPASPEEDFPLRFVQEAVRFMKEHQEDKEDFKKEN